MSTNDYDPRLLQLWHDAAISPKGVYLPFGHDGKAAINRAITLRHRMYRLRVDMRTEKHKWADLAYQCKISIRITLKDGAQITYGHRQKWGMEELAKVELHVVSHAADTSVEDALASAGYSVPQAPEIDL